MKENAKKERNLSFNAGHKRINLYMTDKLYDFLFNQACEREMTTNSYVKQILLKHQKEIQNV